MQTRSKLELDYTPSKWLLLLSQGLNVSVLLLAWLFKLAGLWLLVLSAFSACFAYWTWRKLSNSQVEQLSCVNELWYIKLAGIPQRQQADLWQVKHIASQVFLLKFKINQQNRRAETLYFAADNASESQLRTINRLLYSGQY